MQKATICFICVRTIQIRYVAIQLPSQISFKSRNALWMQRQRTRLRESSGGYQRTSRESMKSCVIQFNHYPYRMLAKYESGIILIKNRESGWILLLWIHAYFWDSQITPILWGNFRHSPTCHRWTWCVNCGGCRSAKQQLSTGNNSI